MTEIERIENNNDKETPNGVDFTILRVRCIKNPEDELDTFKSFIKAFLQNRDLNDEDPKWMELLPEKVVKFTEQLTEDDYGDELISHLSLMIYKLQDVREWEWYSSKINEDGFEVVILGIFRGIFLPIIHHQGIPHKNIFFYTKKRGEFGISDRNNGVDVLTYRSWNPETYELK